MTCISPQTDGIVSLRFRFGCSKIAICQVPQLVDGALHFLAGANANTCYVAGFQDAADICDSFGKRLCSRTEIDLKYCCGTGCSYDSTFVWVANGIFRIISLVLTNRPRLFLKKTSVF